MNLDHLKSLLVKEQERLEKELASIATPNPQLAGDWNAKFPERESGSSEYSSGAGDEEADRREEFEVTIAEEHSLESRLAEVRSALKRIEENTYGVCKTCLKPISEERLGANPAAEYDMEHQPRE